MYSGGCAQTPVTRKDAHRVSVTEARKKFTKKQQDQLWGLRSIKATAQSISIVKHDKGTKSEQGDYRFLIKTEITGPRHRKGCNPILWVKLMSTDIHENHGGPAKPCK